MPLGNIDWKAIKEALTVFGLIGGWVFGAVQWWKSRESKAKLLAITRRGNAPFLCPSLKAFSFIYESADEGALHGWNCSNGNVLCYLREEVSREMPTDTPVIFVLKNDGEDARRVIATLDGKPVQLRQEPDVGSASNLIFLKYDYDASKHGKEQHLTIWFETGSGMQDTHVYSLIHGMRRLNRIEPE